MEPRDAATVMLVRDAPGLEIFMLRRNLRSVFVAGAHVFPGGAVDPDDAAPAMFDAVAGIDAATADARLGRPDALAFWVAAIRESFEEAGVLLARDPASRAPIAIDAVISDELDRDRRALLAGERSFVDIVRDRGLVLDGGALAPVAHYITPEGAPRRYDTWFFVAPAPVGHAYEHDDDETVASTWISPRDAIEQAQREEIDLIYPTFRSLQALADFDTAAELLGAIDAAWNGRESAAEFLDDAGHGWMLEFTEGGDAQVAWEHSVRTGSRGRRERRSRASASATEEGG